MASITIIAIYEKSDNFWVDPWGGVGYWSKMQMKFITRKLGSRKYIETVDEQINMYATRMARNKYIFQRDNAANRVSGLEYYRKLAILVICWRMGGKIRKY